MIEIVDNAPKYYEFIRLLRNDPRVVGSFIDPIYITEQQQQQYMQKHANIYLVALFDKKPAGYVSSNNNDIAICVHPDYQQRGIGKALIKAVMVRFPNSYAKIKIGNEASKELFESCGFKLKYWIMEP